MERFTKLSDVRPCDHCGGSIVHGFWVLHLSQAMFNANNANAVLGLNQMFGGGPQLRALPIAETFAPGDAVLVFGDKDPTLYTTAIICADCFLMRPVDLAIVFDRIHQRQRDGV